MEGLEDINIQPFIGIPNMRKIVKSQYDRLQKGDSDQQHLIFAHVSVDGLAKIERARKSIGKYTRMTHYEDTDLLIVKLSSTKHERAHGNLAKKAIYKLAQMGMPIEEFDFVGATTFHGRNSSKEAYSAYKPFSSRPNHTDWPTIVFESGSSDARWWLVESRGDVKIVIVISIQRAQSMLRIEKWELAPMIAASSYLNNNNNSSLQIPTKTQEITIGPNTVTGAPLILEFAKIFLRPAVPPESDIRFTGQELSAWATRI